jgi:hypothetical protein
VRGRYGAGRIVKEDNHHGTLLAQRLPARRPRARPGNHLGGFTVIEATDLDAALDWAGRLARATTLPIEVRPVQH